MGEISPNGLLCTLGSALKITYVSHIFGLLNSLFKFCSSLSTKFDKNVFGYILGDFFTNSSGHPAAHLHILTKIDILGRALCLNSRGLKSPPWLMFIHAPIWMGIRHKFFFALRLLWKIMRTTEALRIRRNLSQLLEHIIPTYICTTRRS
jgi:hypothetical protein